MGRLKVLILVAMYVALGLVLSPFIYLDIGVAKVFPVQHMLNVCVGVLFGSSYNLMASFSLSTLRILLGLGTIMAYPGSMIGAFLSAYCYKKTQSLWMASVGEVIGTGLIGSLVAYGITAFILQSKAGALAFVIPFTLSSLLGALIVQPLVRILKKYGLGKSE